MTAPTEHPAPGPELDVLVAEKVMGYKWSEMTNFGDRPGWDDHATLFNPEGWMRAQRWKKDGSLSVWCCDCPRLPRYSTDLDAAWEVVEKLRERWLVQIHDVGDRGWRVILLSRDSNEIDFEGSTSKIGNCGTFPLAICRSALLVMT